MSEVPIDSLSGERRRILILTADAGFGHRSAANALASALKEMYGDLCELSIVNPLEDRRTPFFLRDSQADYDKLVRNMPELYRFGYDASDAPVPSVIVEQALTVLLFEVMRDLVRSFRPDVILSTYPLYQPPLRAVNIIQRTSIPILVAVTDLATVHRLWFSSSVDLCLVPTDVVRDLALNYGLAPEQIRVTGIPISPEAFHEQRSPQEIRQAMGWETDIPTVLAIGSRRVDRLVDTLNVLNHFGTPLQLIVVAGKDEKLYRELKETDWHVPVKLYEYIHHVPTFMKAADLIVCKAGGLVITEALACGRPLMLIDVIPGQEMGNADYVVQNGAGQLAREPTEVLEAMSHWMMNNGQELAVATENARRLGKPRSAFDAANVAWLAAERSMALLGGQRATGRLRLVDLLSRNHIPVEEDSSQGRSE